MNRKAVVFALAGLAGCYSYTGSDRVIDLKQRTATITLRDLRSDAADPAEDFSAALSGLFAGTTLEERYPAAKLAGKDFKEGAGQLDFEASFAFNLPEELGLHAWGRGGWRLCASEADMVISSSNADYRDEAGCVIWKKHATVLRVTETRVSPADRNSLLKAYQDWNAAGRPLPSSDEAPAQ